VASIAVVLADLVERRTGFALADEQIERTLLPLATQRSAALALGSPWAWLELLEHEPASGDEWRRVIEVVANGQTSFFRDPEQFAAFGRQLAARAPSGRPIWIWSAGCATGEEAWSLAILCAELGLARRTHIVASDINGEFVARVRQARYSSWALRNVTPDRRARWFDGAGDSFSVSDELRALVDARRHNLVIDEPLRPPEGGWHAILCRNVFIYFRRERMAEACQRLAAKVAADGWLALAASETLRGLEVSLAPEVAHGRVFYRPAPALAAALAARPAAVRPPRATPAPLTAPGSALDEVVQLARRGAIREALARLDQERDDSAIAHHLTRGHLALRLHEIADALSAYRRAADIDSLQCEVHFFTGVAHRKAGEWPAAADALRRALFLAPGFWQAAYLLAGAHERLGRERDAERARERVRFLLAERGPRVVFLSDPLFVEWFSVAEVDARRALHIAT
jgi:chemotaxis protein methyltransferase CheR